ncbi:DNA-binding protein [Gluconobacter albidus]|uniref:Helix-turn-helix domain-containing protein n=1 Tax=Gluconobacter albidus TaxID=318683 RepID=A0ABQ5WZF6_9PROT|nr:DNA-binding protein [Gluconobacter albidus]GBQ93773.1 hypothetical protein AA3250_2910 [Gluconobacter albidus NBRC 3250]GLQ68951.1 hypothetical protein GCM10007866_14020 [Gluconobacter albidus]
MDIEPRFLNREQAAAYVGIGVHVFNQEVKLGIWPQPRVRGPGGGRLTWDRKLLDLYADRDSGIGVATPAATSAAFPAQPGLTHSLAENMSATLTQNRAERRPQEARRRQHH